MDQNTPAEPDLYSLNPMKPVPDRATATTIFQQSLAFYAGLTVIHQALDYYSRWDDGDHLTDLLGTAIVTALTVAVILWVRRRGYKWGGWLILVLGVLGIARDLTSGDVLGQGYGILRGTLLLDTGEIIALLWLGRALRFAGKHGGRLRTEPSGLPG